MIKELEKLINQNPNIISIKVSCDDFYNMFAFDYLPHITINKVLIISDIKLRDYYFQVLIENNWSIPIPIDNINMAHKYFKLKTFY